MPIIIDGKAIQDLNNFNDSFKKSNSIKISNEALKSQKVEIVDQSQYALYVAQNEFAVLRPGLDEPVIIGTDESTTCHILVFKHSGSGVCCLAHLDGSYANEGIHNMLTKLKRLSIGGPEGRYEVHVVGGFMDRKNYSKRLTQDIINCLLKRQEELHLLTYCVCENNDLIRNGIHFPIITGLAVNMQAHHMFPVEFTYKGPDSDIRGAAGFADKIEMKDIYDDKCIIVGPFDWSVSCRIDISSLEDIFIRNNFSTSPEQESKYFVDHIKSSYKILMDNPQSMKSLFRDGLARKYKWNAISLNWDPCF